MEHLWSPWRMEYIENHKGDAVCVFCWAPGQEDGPENLIVHRGWLNYVILNRFPYTNGHLMVVPYEHQAQLESLDPEVRAEMMELTAQAVQVLKAVYHPQAFNLGMNLGVAAGAGIADHLHMHVVPRWSGDTNFMSTVAQTRVLPEALEVTYRRLHEAWLALAQKE